MKTTRAKTIPEYIAQAPPEARSHLREVYALLKRAAPEAREAIKWGSPAFEMNRILFAFAAFRSHLNFMPTPSSLKPFAEDLAKFKTGTGTVQLPYDRPVPKGLILRIARHRVKDVVENDARWM